MSAFYFLLRCPKCGHDMKYHTTTKVLSEKRKRCVYCGHSFKAKDHVMKETGR
jgi:transcription initiation factor IIE alpha subunit